ncbi:MAG: hypothetical protein LBQ59_00455, partial [Candidatus Peribacteria bacterium]|nr:hypothetical protein [Candidatus Peribacteria bacterium]
IGLDPIIFPFSKRFWNLELKLYIERFISPKDFLVRLENNKVLKSKPPSPNPFLLGRRQGKEFVASPSPLKGEGWGEVWKKVFLHFN